MTINLKAQEITSHPTSLGSERSTLLSFIHGPYPWLHPRIKICIRDIQACNIEKHSAKLKVEGIFGIDPKLPLVTSYYLKIMGTAIYVYSKPFTTAVLVESSQVFCAQLDKTLPKKVGLAIMKEIKAMAEGPNPFALEDEEDEDPLNATDTK